MHRTRSGPGDPGKPLLGEEVPSVSDLPAGLLGATPRATRQRPVASLILLEVPDVMSTMGHRVNATGLAEGVPDLGVPGPRILEEVGADRADVVAVSHGASRLAGVRPHHDSLYHGGGRVAWDQSSF